MTTTTTTGFGDSSIEYCNVYEHILKSSIELILIITKKGDNNSQDNDTDIDGGIDDNNNKRKKEREIDGIIPTVVGFDSITANEERTHLHVQ